MRFDSIMELKEPIIVDRKVSSTNNSGTNKALVDSVQTLNETKSRRSEPEGQETFSHLPPMQAALEDELKALQ